MTITALPEVAATPASADRDDDTVHMTCCDPDTALCGIDVTGQPYVDKPVDCWDCALLFLQERPCRVRFCRLRRAWRGWKERLRR